MYKYDIFIDAKIMDEKMLKYNPFFYDEIKKTEFFMEPDKKFFIENKIL